MPRKFFSGNSLEQAILAAAKELKLDPERVAYKEREKKHGVKVSRRTVIEVDLDAPEIDPNASAEAEVVEEVAEAVVEEARDSEESPSEEGAADEGTADEGAADESTDDEGAADEGGDEDEDGEESDDGEGEAESGEDESQASEEDDEDSPDAQDDAEEDSDEEDDDEDDDDDVDDDDDDDDVDEEEGLNLAIRELLEFMKLEAEIKISQRDGLFEIYLSDGDEDFFVEEDGHLLHTMDYLVPRLVRGFIGRSFPCKVDYEGFRARREEDLRQLALDTAEEVQESGKSKTLDAMNPADRRQVHLTLADNPDVETDSVGNGFFKRVRVSVSRET